MVETGESQGQHSLEGHWSLLLRDARYGFRTQTPVRGFIAYVSSSFRISLLFQLLRSCHYLICNDVAVGHVLFFQLSTTSTSAAKTLVVLGSSTAKPIARHPWGTQTPLEEENQADELVQPSDSVGCFSCFSLSQRKKAWPHFPVPIALSPIPPCLIQTLHRIHGQKWALRECWLFELVSRGRINHCRWDLRFAHSTSFFQNSGTFCYVWAAVVTSTSW